MGRAAAAMAGRPARPRGSDRAWGRAPRSCDVGRAFAALSMVSDHARGSGGGRPRLERAVAQHRGAVVVSQRGALQRLVVPGLLARPAVHPRRPPFLGGPHRPPPDCLKEPSMPDTTLETRMPGAAASALDPRRYFEQVSVGDSVAQSPPVCLYLEVTNRCNLLCETCPRTFEELEPPADISPGRCSPRSWTRCRTCRRAVLHGVGEPMLVKNLPAMIRYLKARRAGTRTCCSIPTARCCAPAKHPGDHR